MPDRPNGAGGYPDRPRRTHRLRLAADALAVKAAPALRAARGFGAARVQLRAAALTYLTVVSLAPILTMVLWGLAALDIFRVTEAVRAFVYDNLAVGAREAIEPYLNRLVSDASRQRTLGIGVVLLLGSSVLLLRNVEKAFDDLWGAETRRPLSRQLPRYLAVLFVGPLALGLSLAVTTAFRSLVELYRLPLASLIGALLPLALSCLGFFTLFLLAPPARVRARAAAAGALVAALAWEAAKLIYTAYAARSVEADVVYGPLAAMPLFLVWIYVSWLITLFGARLAFVLQHPREILADDERSTARALELAATRIAVALAPVAQRADAPTFHGLARSLGLPEGTVRSAVGHLEAAGLVHVEGRRPALTRPASDIRLREVVAAVRGKARGAMPGEDPETVALAGLLGHADETALASLEGVDLASLAATGGPGAPPADGPPLAKT